MRSKKKSKPAGKRGIKDLPVSDAKAKNAKGGNFSPVVKGAFKGTISKGLGVLPVAPQGSGGGYTQDEMAQDLK
jgi:hypothetical protein